MLNKKWQRIQERLDEKSIQEEREFLSWMQSFSKKIVTAFSIIYILVIAVIVGIIIVELKLGGIENGIDTLITEINETFRVVIGGYLIKATVENGSKIVGEYLASVNLSKLQAKAAQYKFEAAVDPEKDYSIENIDENDEDLG